MDHISPQLREVLREYGETWQIQHDSHVWTAIRRPTPTALHLIVAYDLPGLEAKLKAQPEEH